MQMFLNLKLLNFKKKMVVAQKSTLMRFVVRALECDFGSLL